VTSDEASPVLGSRESSRTVQKEPKMDPEDGWMPAILVSDEVRKAPNVR
jgi:hypothetical protein